MDTNLFSSSPSFLSHSILSPSVAAWRGIGTGQLHQGRVDRLALPISFGKRVSPAWMGTSNIVR